MRFIAKVMTSTLPVRSPLPNSVPSTRSQPASWASSAAATAVPRSLWGWTLRTMEDRLGMLRWKYSMTSAYTLGPNISTVFGRLMTILWSGEGSITSITAEQISTA
jgi:hypothetical protein